MKVFYLCLLCHRDNKSAQQLSFPGIWVNLSLMSLLGVSSQIFLAIVPIIKSLVAPVLITLTTASLSHMMLTLFEDH